MVLEWLFRVLEQQPTGERRAKIIAEMEKCGGVEKIKLLQNHGSARKIVLKYF